MIGVEVDYPLGANILKKKFPKMNPGQIAAKKNRNKFGSKIMFIQNCEISLFITTTCVFFCPRWYNEEAFCFNLSTMSVL